MTRPKLLVAGNWKMHGLTSDLVELKAISDGLPQGLAADIAVFLPATLLPAASAILWGTPIRTGGQNCHAEEAGAFTGDLSATMLKDTGASYVLLGHSERRGACGELSRDVRRKAEAAMKQDLSAIVCVGETAGERDLGLAAQVCNRQLRESLPDRARPANTIIAYEPVWAIGSGALPSVDDLQTIFKDLRDDLKKQYPQIEPEQWRILYGGSVTPSNADMIFASGAVDGVLVGSASLKAASFLPIIDSAQRAPIRN